MSNEKNGPDRRLLIFLAGLLLVMVSLVCFLGKSSHIVVHENKLVNVFKISWFDISLLAFLVILGCSIAFFSMEYETYAIASKSAKIIKFFKSKGKRIILFSLSFVFLVISVANFTSVASQGMFLKNFYKFDTVFDFVLLAISTNILFFATFSQENTLFKK